MKILFLSTWFPYPADNGSKIRVYHLLRALGQRHTVTLLSFAFGTARPEQVEARDIWCDRVDVVERNPFDRGRLAQALRFLSPSPIVDAPIAEMTRRASELLSQTRFDVVIASTTATATYALLTHGMPRVLEEHNLHSRWASERFQQQVSTLARLQAWVSWQKRRRYDARLCARFNLCTMVSEQDRAACVELLGHRGRVEVVPNGVDCHHNRPGLAQPLANRLVFNGALTYSANYDAMRYFLSEVYALIRQQAPDVSLTITGSLQGVDLGGLRLDESVHLSGYVHDVRPLVAGATTCVVPIRQGGGTRLKILEAMALGTPVVATSKGAEGLQVTHGEHLLLADDPGDFAACTVRLLVDPGLCLRLAASARRLVEERYDWELIGSHFAQLVERLASDWHPT